jgi:RNA polymerase sigma-70 factor (ECF subfamily)
MLTLVKNYRDKSEDDWGPLFHRIMQSRIRDWYRRRGVRNRLFGWLGFDADAEAGDPIQQVGDPVTPGPVEQLGGEELLRDALAALRELPLRQQQTFLLRAWQGYSTAETATIMGCTEGTVKTQYSRAVHALRAQLDEHQA